MAELYQIETGKTIPAIGGRRKKHHKATATLAALKPNQSFFVPNLTQKQVVNVRAHLADAVREFKQHTPHAAFTTRSVNGGLGVYRTV